MITDLEQERGGALAPAEAEDEPARDAASTLRVRLRALTEATTELSGARSLESILHAAAEHARSLTGAQYSVGISTHSSDRTGVFTAASFSSHPPDRHLLEYGPNGAELLSALSGLSAVLRFDPNAQKESRDARLEDSRLEGQLFSAGFMAAPLIDREGRQLGALVVARPSCAGFSADEEALLAQLASTTALALENVFLRRAGEAAARARDEFLTTLSHELRTPLTTILGWSRLLRTGEFDPGVRDRALETIDRNARLQARLIDDLLDTTHIMAGKLRIEPRPIELEPLIREAVDSVSGEARKRGIELRTDLEMEGGAVVGDPARLRQVALNLLSNALKFTPSGGCVRVRLDQSGSQVRLEVSDTGEGISEEFLPHVFERFRQEDSSTSRSHTGLGLGLTIVRSVAQLHGGVVRVSSGGSGKGATFTVLLPAAGPVIRPVGDPGQRWGRENVCDWRRTHSRVLEGRRVLLVDDNTDTLELLSSLLEEAGAQVMAARTAARALVDIAEWRPDLLISDLGLPDESGYALMRKVRALPAKRGGGVPALLLTAYAGESERVLARKAGFQRFIAKPALPAELLEAAAELAGRTMAREAG